MAVEFEDFQRRLGGNIRQARLLSGKTQEQITSVTLRYFQETERGERNPTIQVLHDLASELGVTVADLCDVPGARVSNPRIEKKIPKNPPKPGRKPKSHPRSR